MFGTFYLLVKLLQRILLAYNLQFTLQFTCVLDRLFRGLNCYKCKTAASIRTIYLSLSTDS